MKHSDVMSLRLKHFASIIASQYEIMPYSVLEPMSLGSPLIATAVGGIPELIQDQRNGLLVPSQDTKAMVAACRMLLDDRGLAARLGRQGWCDCRNFYDPENIAKQTIATYENAIEQFNAHNDSMNRS
jgi:glycosyltransferase involved in cell wall biosynthesis